MGQPGSTGKTICINKRRSSSILGSRQMGRLPPFYSPTLVECGNLEDSVWGWARIRLATICTDISACSLLLPAALTVYTEVSNWLLYELFGRKVGNGCSTNGVGYVKTTVSAVGSKLSSCARRFKGETARVGWVYLLPHCKVNNFTRGTWGTTTAT